MLHKKQQTLEISSLSFIQLGRAFLGFKMGVSRIPSGEIGQPAQISLKENITFIYHPSQLGSSTSEDLPIMSNLQAFPSLP